MKILDFFQKMDNSRFYSKPMHQADDSSDDQSDNLKDSLYEAGSSELESDYLKSSSNQSYAEMNTTKDDDDTSQAEDQTNQPPEPTQNDWVNIVMATSIYIKEEYV